jgi:hypothetical protein
VLAEGTSMVRRELPRLLREQPQLQGQWQQLQAEGEALDLGHAHFGEVGWGAVMAPGEMLDGFLAYRREASGVDRDA